MERDARRSSLLLLLLCALLWSLGGVLIKSVDWHPLAIAGGRSTIAALVIFAYLRKPNFTWSRIQLLGALAYAATVCLFVLATKLTTAANAIMLQFTAPVWVAIFGAWFLKEWTTRIDWIAIVLALSGMTLFFIDELSADNFTGNLVAICSGVAFAWMTLLLRKQKDASPLESILLGNIATAIIGIPFILTSDFTVSNSFGVLILGVIQLALPYIIFSYAIRHVTALEAILIPVIEPILNPVWVMIFMQEKPGKFAIFGGAVVISSILFKSIFSFKKMRSL
ncbi:MAG TPA: EamA family transporter [Patescibacteria group bacterium]|nr:EamA family transporter [Patescibacteria group bacterium]